MSWDDELVTLERFNHVGQAELARAALESAGIDAALADEFSARMGGEKGTGGVRLQVRRHDVERATEVLREPVDLAYEPEVDEHEAYPADVCRRCGSEEIYPLVPPRRVALRATAAAILALLALNVLRRAGLWLAFDLLTLGIIGAAVAATLLGVIAGKKHCRNCGAKWRGTQRTA